MGRNTLRPFFYISTMNHLIKTVLIPFIFLIPLESVAQKTNEYSEVSFSLRGKYFLFSVGEDIFWRAYSYGGEIYIGKHHAIGVDGGVFRLRNEIDDSDDKEMYSDITRRSYVYVDYKYIHPFSPRFSLYAQVYSKLFGRRMDWKEKYDYEYKTPVDLTFLQETTRGTFTDVGIGVGGKFYFTDLNLGLDLSVNLYKHYYKNVATNYSEETGWSTEDLKEVIVPVYVRLNLFYHFWRFRHKP